MAHSTDGFMLLFVGGDFTIRFAGVAVPALGQCLGWQGHRQVSVLFAHSHFLAVSVVKS